MTNSYQTYINHLHDVADCMNFQRFIYEQIYDQSIWLDDFFFYYTSYIYASIMPFKSAAKHLAANKCLEDKILKPIQIIKSLSWFS